MGNERADIHAQPAQLHHHVGAACQFLQIGFPGREHRVGLAGIGTDTQRAAAVIEDHHGLRYGTGQRCDLLQLRMILPGLIGQAERAKLRYTLAVIRLTVQALRRVGVAVAHIRTGVPAARVADAAKAAIAGSDVRLEHGPCPGAKGHIHVGDDASAGPRLAVDATGAHGGDAVGELGFANRLHRHRAIGAVHRATIDVNRGGDVMARAGISQQFIEQVAVVGVLPKVMVRIDDRQVWLKDVLARLPGQPRFVGHMGARLALHCRCHRFLRFAHDVLTKSGAPASNSTQRCPQD